MSSKLTHLAAQSQHGHDNVSATEGERAGEEDVGEGDGTTFSYGSAILGLLTLTAISLIY